MSDMNLVIQGPNIHVCAIRTPAHRRHRTPDLEHGDGLLPAFLAALPHLHRPIIRPCGEQLDASPTRQRPVERVDDPAMCADFPRPLARCDVHREKRVVSRDRIERGGQKGPLEVEDGRLGEVRQEAVVGVWGVCAPECCACVL